MDFVIKTKDEDGNITFEGTANATQASFLFEVGVNYLLQRGVQPVLGDAPTPVEGPETVQ